MPILRPNQLPAATTPLSATDLIVVDQGAGGVNAADPQDVVDIVAPVASQAEAEAGFDNTKRMTSLRTKQSIASEVGVSLASKAQGDLASSAVQPARQVIAGAGLTGGGSLSGDVTLNVGAGSGIAIAADSVGLDATTQSRLLIGGGTTSQVLQKNSNSDYDVSWTTVAAATAVSYAPQTLSGPEQAQARTNIGLGNVDNTSDANKPVSTATQTALNLKADLASPVLTGNPTAPTASAGDNDTTIATTAFVTTAVAASFNLASSVATTSGTSVDFTGIPTTAKRVTLNLYGVSTNGTSDIVVQLGTSGGVEATGYAGTISRVGTAAVASVGTTGANFATVANNIASASSYFGKVVFEKVSGNLWTIIGHTSTGNDNQTNTSVFGKTTASSLDRVRLTTAGGANTFDAGTASISWEI